MKITFFFYNQVIFQQMWAEVGQENFLKFEQILCLSKITNQSNLISEVCDSFCNLLITESVLATFISKVSDILVHVR